MARKTVDIIRLIEQVNIMNRNSICDRYCRVGWNVMLDDILHRADVYAGFTYLTQDRVPKDQLPGVVHGDKPENNEFPDDSRVEWLIHHKLK